MRSLAPSRRFHSIPTWSRTRSRALGKPYAIRYTIGTNYQSRRLDSHQHRAVYKTAAFLNRATSATQAGVQGFEPCHAALETASSPRRTLLYRPRPCDRGLWRNNYSFSVTFQYASLMNFDQLSIRMLWSA